MIAVLQYRLLPLLLTLTAGYLAYSTLMQSVSIPFLSDSPILSAGLLFVLTFVLGWASASLTWLGVKHQWTGSAQQETLRREKAQAASEVASDQVRALESKIQTLEKALERALKERA